MGRSRNYLSSEPMAGSWGYVYLDGDEVIEHIGFTARTTISYGDIRQPGKLAVGKKMLDTSGTGTLKMNTIDHRVQRKIAAHVAAGKTPMFYITGVQDDPDSKETLGYGFKNCTFENIDWLNLEPATVSTQELSFSFEEVVNLTGGQI